MEGTLHRYPFHIEDQGKRLLLARYLIEDQGKSFHYFDENQSSNVTVVKSVFRTLMSSVQPFTVSANPYTRKKNN